jgi:hypothetical protein
VQERIKKYLMCNNDGLAGSAESPDKSGVFGRSTAGAGLSGRSSGQDGILGITSSANNTQAGIRVWCIG